jgi:hypothetical protein
MYTYTAITLTNLNSKITANHKCKCEVTSLLHLWYTACWWLLWGNQNMQLQSTIATLKLFTNRLYSFIMYFRNTMAMPCHKMINAHQKYIHQYQNLICTYINVMLVFIVTKKAFKITEFQVLLKQFASWSSDDGYFGVTETCSHNVQLLH